MASFLHRKNTKYVPWPPKQLLSAMEGNRPQFCHEIGTRKYGKGNYIGHDESFSAGGYHWQEKAEGSNLILLSHLL